MVEADSSKAGVPTAGSLVRMSWPQPPAKLGSGPVWARLPPPAPPAPCGTAPPQPGAPFPHTLS